ncbi:MAG TPA: alpha/beta hydrolase [Kutzneria sp.]|jgi:pimeloyl-ACP methyl ester carboxylesterase
MIGERLNNGLTVITAGDGPHLVTLPGLGAGADLATKVPPFTAFSATTLASGLHRRIHHIQRPVNPLVGITLPDLAAWHAEALRTRFEGPVDVMGTSGGGATALQIALDHPDTIRRLVLCMIAGRPGEEGRRRLVRLMDGERRGHNNPWAASGLVTRGPQRLLIAAMYAATAVTGKKRAPGEFALVEAIKNWDVTNRLHELRAPTLLIAGGRDTLIPADNARATAAAIPNCRLLMIGGGDHLTTMFDRRAAPAIREFLA